MVSVDVYFDTSCPWCYIGKRRLEHALARRGAANVEVRWRPFLLNPDLPARGMQRSAYLRQKFGSAHRVNRIFDAIEAAGVGENIDFRFDLIDRTPNTVNSHRLIRYAIDHGRAWQAVEAVFHAYFAEGRDIGDPEVLASLGEGLGLNRDSVRYYIEDGSDASTIFAENTRAHRLGITGVPCFIFNESSAIAGAQEIEVFLRLLDLASESEIEAVSVF